jgi:death-on-curing protein
VREPDFLRLEEVLYLHEQSLHLFGGLEGIGNSGLIESALASAQNDYWYGKGDLCAISAAYAYHIAQAQAFTDGNKRTGIASALVFLERNGVDVPVDDGSIYSALIAIAEKQMDKNGLATVLRKLCSH